MDEQRKKDTPEEAADRLQGVLTKQRKEDTSDQVRRIRAIYIMASELSAHWDHTGTNMIEGYPPCLPSWDEFVGELGAWYEAQEKRRQDGR